MPFDPMESILLESDPAASNRRASSAHKSATGRSRTGAGHRQTGGIRRQTSACSTGLARPLESGRRGFDTGRDDHTGRVAAAGQTCPPETRPLVLPEGYGVIAKRIGRADERIGGR